MSDDTEIWIRVHRDVFNDARIALADAAEDLDYAYRDAPHATHYKRTSDHARAAAEALEVTGVGIAINPRETAA